MYLICWEDGSLSQVQELDESMIESVEDGILDIVRIESGRFQKLAEVDENGDIEWVDVDRV